MGSYKKFDQSIHDLTNQSAVNAVLEHLDRVGLYGHINDDLYGPDILVYSGFRHLSYIEVEIKLVWKSGDFPYPTVNLPERKGKYLRLRKTVEYWILRADLQHVVIIPETELSSSILHEVPNRLVGSGELFYQVPIENCILKTL